MYGYLNCLQRVFHNIVVNIAKFSAPSPASAPFYTILFQTWFLELYQDFRSSSVFRSNVEK